MSTAPRFHDLRVTHISPEAANAVAVTLGVPNELKDTFAFTPGQFVTVRTDIQGQDVRRSYSICSTRRDLSDRGQLSLGIRPVEGGVFSNWAASELQVGHTLSVMPPQGRFTIHKPRAIHRVGFAAGSGITPILSIIASTLEEDANSKFTLVYGNRRMSSVMFNESLQDLKDRYASRLTLIHILSRQAQEVPLLEGRIDGDKVRAIVQTLLPIGSMDEVFICGPEAMIEATEQALLDQGLRADRIHTERFSSPTADAPPITARQVAGPSHLEEGARGEVELTVILDGKPHPMRMAKHQKILDIALHAGLDLPWSCKGGVCCTCRAKVMEGAVQMERNFTLEPWEMEQGFVLSCQALPTTDRVTLSYDER
jgi:ring-1,2-phenylacetyl-CoA epoxidase subunit PaaE